MKGRPLEITDINEPLSEETNFIIVDRVNILQTSFEELSDKTTEELGKTLEVQFYTEVSCLCFHLTDFTLQELCTRQL